MSEALELKFNTPFQQAVDAANRRGVVLPQTYYGELQKELRSQAFTVSFIPKVEQISQILDSLQKAQVSGISLARWQKEVDHKKFGITKAHAETVFRNAMQTHYAIGHWESFQQTKKALPYLRYVTINDSRTSQCCRALSGIIRKVDDPFWATHTPPNHHRCRSTLQALTESQAQRRSPNGTGLNQPETPEMQPQKGWDYNAAQSHQTQMTDLAKAKIEKLPPVIKSKAEKILADKATMIDKQAFADYVEKVTYKDYKARHEFVRVGTLPDFVMADSAVKELEPINNEIHVSDYQLRHSQRNEKIAPLPLEQLKNLPEKLDNSRWFYDKSHDNLIAVFDIGLDGKLGKSAKIVNFKRKNFLGNAIVTTGIIDEFDLNNPNYIEISETP